MLSEQSQYINPLHLAKNNKQIKGAVSLDLLERLEGILLDYQGQVEYSLFFDFDTFGICIIKSNINTKVLLSCQRCLKPLIIDIEKTSTLGIYRDLEELRKLSANYEPFQLNEEFILIKTLVEDELLLAIPIAPLHKDINCIKREVSNEIKNTKKVNPFSVLGVLKNRKLL